MNKCKGLHLYIYIYNISTEQIIKKNQNRFCFNRND